jgi:hypothetical protein
VSAVAGEVVVADGDGEVVHHALLGLAELSAGECNGSHGGKDAGGWRESRRMAESVGNTGQTWSAEIA